MTPQNFITIESEGHPVPSMVGQTFTDHLGHKYVISSVDWRKSTITFVLQK